MNIYDVRNSIAYRKVCEMKRTCNIDRRGRVARAIWGACFVALGVALLVWRPSAGWVGWIAVASCLGMGVFSIIEACIGWCVMRAMGWKTPM